MNFGMIILNHSINTMQKPVYLGLAILEFRKTFMYEFWYNYIKPKYQHNAKLCYIDTDSFIIHIKTENVYKDIAHDVKKRFDTSNYEDVYKDIAHDVKKRFDTSNNWIHER